MSFFEPIAIESISAFECLDSRGFPTISATVILSDGSGGTAMVPSGASTGEHEAHELRDGDAKRFNGKGVTQAVQNIAGPINDALCGESALDQRAIDQALNEIDGSENKSNLGANAILAVSLACAHASANHLGIPLFRYVGGTNARRLPVPLVNVINGGAHAANSLDIQEFMLVPHFSDSFAENLRASCEVFQTLKKNLKKKGLATGVGDEGGFAPDLANSEAALECLVEAISDSGYEPGKQIALALDVAASEWWDEKASKYVLHKSSKESFTSNQLIDLYESWLKKFPLVSIEDGLDENDWDGWAELTKRLGAKVQLIGDDLFVTNSKILKKGLDTNCANALLVKPNQIGTLSETIDAVHLAQRNKYNCIMSHRSGETEDTTIADLSVALECGQIKTGSVCRSERTAKYNRLLWIEHFLGEQAYVASPFKKL